jgi:crossover junction endodeoxyribonuclease RusA
MKKLIIPGRPVPHVRMTQRSKHAEPQAQRYLAYKEQVGWVARAAQQPIITGPLELVAHFFLCGGQVPDLSNLVKAIEDGLNGIAYQDDRQVCSIKAMRIEVPQKCLERAEVQVCAVEWVYQD